MKVYPQFGLKPLFLSNFTIKKEVVNIFYIRLTSRTKERTPYALLWSSSLTGRAFWKRRQRKTLCLGIVSIPHTFFQT